MINYEEMMETNRKTEIRIMIAMTVQIAALAIQLISTVLILVALKM